MGRILLKIFSFFLADKNVLFTNDSLLFFESHSKILDQNIYDMIHNGDKDVYGLTINYASHKHIGSFFLYVKKNTKASSNLLRYFKRYIPLTSRSWSISQGECGMSDAIFNSNSSITPRPHLKLLKTFILSLSGLVNT